MQSDKNYATMVRLLWFVGFCGEVPTGVAPRIGGSPEWNRHVLYRAVKLGYLTVFRKEHNHRMVRTLRLTDEGLDYIGAYDAKALSYILAKSHGGTVHTNQIDKTLRNSAVATAIVMAYSAGAEILPDRKPLLGKREKTNSAAIGKPVFYSAQELRRGLALLDPKTVPKTSRMLGVIVSGTSVYLLYYTGRSRMFWMRNQEENFLAMIKTLLSTAGFHVKQASQVLIADDLRVAVRIAKYGRRNVGKYFSLSDEYDHCYFLTNNREGDQLLSLLVHRDRRIAYERAILKDYELCDVANRIYDARTRDLHRPVALGYPFDLLQLTNLDPLRCASKHKPILLCLDYQTDIMQEIVGPDVEVRGTDSREVKT